MMTSDNQLPVTKRVRYFNGQFLKSQDFIDEQKYHNDRQRRPYQFLHVSGICDGLTVTKDNANQKQVTVAPGTALDAQGRLIVLEQPQNVEIQNQADQTVNIYISYEEESSDITQQGNDESGDGAIEGVKGATRWWEKPKIEVVEGEKQDGILLATVTLDASGNVTEDINIEQRQYSGVRLPSGDGTAPELRSGGNGDGAVLNGSLSITGNLNVDGNIGIGTTNPTHKLEVVGSGSSEQLVSIRSDNDVSLELRSTHAAGGTGGEVYYELADGNNGAGNSWKIGTNDDGKLHFAYGPVNSINSQEKMTILTDGKVGISMTSPTAKLQVSGDLKLQSGVAVNEFSSDGTLSDNSDTAVPTEKAVKSYADTKAQKNGDENLDFSIRNLLLTGKLEMAGEIRIETEEMDGFVCWKIKYGEKDLFKVMIYPTTGEEIGFLRFYVKRALGEFEIGYRKWVYVCLLNDCDPDATESLVSRLDNHEYYRKAEGGGGAILLYGGGEGYGGLLLNIPF